MPFVIAGLLVGTAFLAASGLDFSGWFKTACEPTELLVAEWFAQVMKRAGASPHAMVVVFDLADFQNQGPGLDPHWFDDLGMRAATGQQAELQYVIIIRPTGGWLFANPDTDGWYVWPDLERAFCEDRDPNWDALERVA